jgi:hypothetical protein
MNDITPNPAPESVFTPEVSGADTVPDTNPDLQVVPDVTPAPTPAPVSASPSADDIADAVRRGMQQDQPPAQLTQDQINEQLKVWNPNEEFATSFAQSFAQDENGQVDPSKIMGVLQQMHSAQMQQSQTYAQALGQQMQQQFGQQIAPMQQQHAAAQKQQLRSEFTTQYPALKQFEQLIDTAGQQVQASGQSFATKEALYPAIASAMEQIIKTMNPSFTLNNAPPAGNQGGITPASLMSNNHAGAPVAPAAASGSSSIWG